MQRPLGWDPVGEARDVLIGAWVKKKAVYKRPDGLCNDDNFQFNQKFVKP